MKKTIFVLFCFVLANVFLTGCTVKNNSQTINYSRRLQNYLPSDAASNANQKPNGAMIDLSDGPKLQYDARLGPGDLNFDIKIKTQY